MAGAQLGKGIGDDSLAVGLLEWYDAERHAQQLARRANVVEVFLPGATGSEDRVVLEPDLQVCGLGSLASGDQLGEGDGAVDTPRNQHGRCAHRGSRR